MSGGSRTRGEAHAASAAPASSDVGGQAQTQVPLRSSRNAATAVMGAITAAVAAMSAAGISETSRPSQRLALLSAMGGSAGMPLHGGEASSDRASTPDALSGRISPRLTAGDRASSLISHGHEVLKRLAEELHRQTSGSQRRHPSRNRNQSVPNLQASGAPAGRTSTQQQHHNPLRPLAIRRSSTAADLSAGSSRGDARPPSPSGGLSRLGGRSRSQALQNVFAPTAVSAGSSNAKLDSEQPDTSPTPSWRLRSSFLTEGLSRVALLRQQQQQQIQTQPGAELLTENNETQGGLMLLGPHSGERPSLRGERSHEEAAAGTHGNMTSEETLPISGGQRSVASRDIGPSQDSILSGRGGAAAAGRTSPAGEGEGAPQNVHSGSNNSGSNSNSTVVSRPSALPFRNST